MATDGITFDCPYCLTRDIEISKKEVDRAIRNRNMTDDKIMIGCPKCSKVLVISGDSTNAIQEWKPEVNKDCCCVPWLTDDVIRMPAGVIRECGVKFRPGGGGPAIGKFDYMVKYGIDPEIYFR